MNTVLLLAVILTHPQSLKESTTVDRNTLAASHLPMRKTSARKCWHFLPHHHSLFNYPSSHYLGSVPLHHVPEGSPLTSIPFISIGLCKVRIICISTAGLRDWSKRNYLLWSHGKLEMAEMGPVRSRLKAPGTLKGKKKWMHRGSGRIAFFFFCLV